MYFLKIPSTHTSMGTQQLYGIGNQQYLIPVLQSLETESQLQLVLDVNIDSPIMSELLKSPNSCTIPTLPKNQELNLETLNSILINASDLKLVSASQLNQESSEVKQEKVENINETVIPKKCIGSKYVSIYDTNVLPRAVLTLPPPLVLRKNVIITRRTIPSNCRFGPVKGLKRRISEETVKSLFIKSGDDKKPVFIIKNEESLLHIDVTDQDKSNWFSLVSLGKTEDANLWLKQEDGELFAITLQNIPPRTEIKLGYNLEYIGDHDHHQLPVVDFDIVTPVKSYQTWLYGRCECANDCTKCNRDVSGSRSKRAHFKCKLCGSRFVRQYTLKRHIRKHCSKNVDTLIMPTKKEPTTTPVLTQSAPSTEDTKISSDDSFNNFYTLDFSTSLFDPQRISNLDISVRSDEFELCAIGGKNDNCLNDAITYSKANVDVMNLNTPLLSNCKDCNQIIVTDRLKSHIRLCPAKKLKCECAKKKVSQKQLNNHKKTNHKIEGHHDRYVCKDCNITFKRRGMLVNHEHKRHGRVVSPALYKCIVHYKCPACPNKYATVAKRKIHVHKHHPGVDPKDGETIKCGSSKRSAVKCEECYRQYSTRAKMLQHLRLCHADKHSTSVTKNSNYQFNKN